MKIKLDENGKVISILNVGIGNDYIDAPEIPSDHEFGVSDYVYLNGKYNKIAPVMMNELTVEPHPTIEERVTEIEQVQTEQQPTLEQQVAELQNQLDELISKL